MGLEALVESDSDGSDADEQSDDDSNEKVNAAVIGEMIA
jgi:hypothetical protein